jgi:hypothetical protein
MTPLELQIDFCETNALSPLDLHALCTVCETAYEEDITPVLHDIGPGLHAFGRVN